MEDLKKLNQVLEALASPDWNFRTIKGISKQTGIDETAIRSILESKIPDYVRRYPFPCRGEILYAPAGRKRTIRESLVEFYDMMRAFAGIVERET